MNRKLISISLVIAIYLSLSGCHAGGHPKKPQSNQSDEKHEIQVTRFGSVIKLKPEKHDFYRELHANPWPEVDSLLKISNIINYSIYYRDGYLFSYLEYTGEDWEADMAKLGTEPVLKEWWKLTDPCQEPVKTAAKGEWWAPMEEMYHLD